jgi:hypothetical protein
MPSYRIKLKALKLKVQNSSLNASYFIMFKCINHGNYTCVQVIRTNKIDMAIKKKT